MQQKCITKLKLGSASHGYSIFIFGVCIFFVIGLVGLCCKPQPFVIIIIIDHVRNSPARYRIP